MPSPRPLVGPLHAAALATLVACGAARPPTVARPSPEPALWSYAMTFDGDVERADVTATFSRSSGTFTFPAPVAPFVDDVVAFAEGVTPSAVFRRENAFEVAACRGRPCRLRYRIDLGRTARSLRDVDFAAAYGRSLVVPPSTWLARDDGPADGARYRFTVTPSGGAVFASSTDPRPGELDAYEAPVSTLIDAPFAAFGRWRLRSFTAGGARVTVALADGSYAMDDAALEAWIEDGVVAVSRYFDGHFPVARLLVLVTPAGAPHVVDGVTQGGGGAAVLLRVGRAIDADAARSDWVLVHELMHVCFPTLGHPHRWMEEGLSTYVEPIVRARHGDVSAERFWSELAEGLPRGLPEPADRGLEFTPTWGRTYWGGAIFWFLADIRIRERTAGRKSVDDALRSIAKSGGTVAHRWVIDDVIAKADAATGVPVLRELYTWLGEHPGEPDLRELFQDLGVSVRGTEVRFDESARLAGVRRAITRSSSL